MRETNHWNFIKYYICGSKIITMIIDGFIEQIEEEFEDLEQGIINKKSKFKEVLDWSSVNALILISLIDSEYEVTINATDLNTSETFGDLFQIIQSRMAE